MKTCLLAVVAPVSLFVYRNMIQWQKSEKSLALLPKKGQQLPKLEKKISAEIGSVFI